MDTLLQFGGDYWPYLLGIFFVGVTLFNIRHLVKPDEKV